MQEHRAAAAGYSWRSIVVDLDDKIIKAVLARQPVAMAVPLEPQGPIVVPAGRILAPGVFGPDRANRQEGFGTGMAIGPPPHAQRPECAPGGSAVTFALVGSDTAATERDRYRQPARCEPAPARIARCGANANDCQWTVTRGFVGSH